MERCSLCSWPGSYLLILRSLQVLCPQEDSPSSVLKLLNLRWLCLRCCDQDTQQKQLHGKKGFFGLTVHPGEKAWRVDAEMLSPVGQEAQWQEPGMGTAFKGAPWKKVTARPQDLSHLPLTFQQASY